MIRASIIGGTGYAAGELIRLLHGHPEAQIQQVVSRSRAGKFIHSVNPNLRKVVTQKFEPPNHLKPCEVLFLCLPHGEAVRSVDHYMEVAPNIIDLSADFRFNSKEQYRAWYEAEHPRPDLLEKFAYGIPEVNRRRIAESKHVACAGCNATAVILGLKPLIQDFEVRQIVAEVKVGSSEGGRTPNEGSHHPVRSGAVRSYRPQGHRHVGEMIQELDIEQISFSATSIEMVRGILATCHVFIDGEMPSEQDLWRTYRAFYSDHPCIRIVKERSGTHRYPEPKLLRGTNFCDIGFDCDVANNRIVVISALDNLMKGASGQAVQVFNIMHDFPETLGLEFPGLHPA